jgi:hypothetical protein
MPAIDEEIEGADLEVKIDYPPLPSRSTPRTAGRSG